MAESPAGRFVGPWQPGRWARIGVTAFLVVMGLLNQSLFWAGLGQVAAGGNDFMHLYAAGQMTREGAGGALYEREAQFEAQSAVSPLVRVAGEPYPYMRPPFEALLFVPFSLLSLKTAFALWTVLNLTLLAWLILAWRARLPALRVWPWVAWVAAVPAFLPFVVLLAQGQDVLLVLGLFSLAWFALRDGRDGTAGAWLGLACFRPQYALPMIAIFALGGRWRVLRGAAAVAAGYAALTAGVFGWEMLIDYPRRLWSAEGTLNRTGFLLEQMPSLHGLLSVTLRSLPEGAIFAAVVVLSALVFGATVWFHRRHAAREPELAWSFAVLATILVSYHAFEHGLALLWLPLLLQLSWLHTRRFRPLTPWLLFVPAWPLFQWPLGLLLLRYGLVHLYPLALTLWLAALGTCTKTGFRGQLKAP